MAQSRHLSYTTHAFAFEEGSMLMALIVYLNNSLVEKGRKLLAGMHFDQIWINDVVHMDIDETLLQNISAWRQYELVLL